MSNSPHRCRERGWRGATGLLREGCCSGSIPAAPPCSGQAAGAEPTAGRHRGSLPPCWGSLSPVTAGSPRGGKGKMWLWPPACGSNFQAGGVTGRLRSSLAQDAAPGGGAAPSPSLPITLRGFGATPAAMKPPDPGPAPAASRAAPTRELGQDEPSAAGNGWASRGAGAVEHTAAIQPGCRARPWVNTPGSGPQ